MLKNFFKIAYRNLWRSKGFSAINIFGLAIGMAAAMLIFIWIQNELSYDRFHSNRATLYEAWNREVFDEKLSCWNTTPKILGPTLKQDYPDIENTARVNWPNSFLFSIGDKRIKASGNCVDPSFLSMFSFPLLKGNPGTALGDVYSIAITESFSRRLFGDQDPVGKIVKIDNRDNFTVKALMKDLPGNTKFSFDFLLPWSYLDKRGWSDSNWDNNSTETYVQLKTAASPESVNGKIRNITIKHLDGKEKIEVFLHPIDKWHLYADFKDGKLSGGFIETVRMFGIIASFILIIACINFMNLSTARSEKRAKEVGLRKVVGAQKKSLVLQFLGESVLFAFLAGIIALILVQLSIGPFNNLTQKQLYIKYGSAWFWFLVLLFILVTGMLAGSYPAFYLSSFQPVKVLKGSFRAAHKSVNPRKILVVLQFCFAIILIICTLIVKHQIDYAQHRKIGYDRENLVFHMITGDIDKNFELIRTELLSSGTGVSVSKTSAPLTEGWSNTWGLGWEGKDINDKTIFDRFCADRDIVRTAGFSLVEGRDLDVKEYPTDSMGCLLNESAVRKMGFKQPIGQIVKDDSRDWHVVGVIKDFVLQSPYAHMQPMIIEGAKGWFNVMHIKLNASRSTYQNLQDAERIFKKYNPQYPFEYKFIDQEYALKFEDTQRTATLMGLFAGLTILISCLGLFGLAAYMAANRTKEIGVRKVLGASVMGIAALLSREFLALVMIALIIAVPVAWYAMFNWLKGYEYHITIEWWVFVAAGLLSLFIALITVSVQSVRAAMSNPVISLRAD